MHNALSSGRDARAHNIEEKYLSADFILQLCITNEQFTMCICSYKFLRTGTHKEQWWV